MENEVQVQVRSLLVALRTTIKDESPMFCEIRYLDKETVWGIMQNMWDSS